MLRSRYLALHKNNLIIYDFYGRGNLMSLRNLENLEKIPIIPIAPKKPMANSTKNAEQSLGISFPF